MISFTAQLENAINELTEITLDNARDITSELFRSIEKDTPVDTSAARANYNVTLNAPSRAYNENKRATLAEKVAEIDNVIALSNLDTKYYLTNYSPYIERLEYGYSNQAPTGMVRKNFARLPSIVRGVVNNG